MDRVEAEHGIHRPHVNRVGFGAIGLVLACLVLLVPVLITPMPPIGDYPNHLARLWLLSSPEAQAVMAPFYRVNFDTYTNVAIDLVALTLGKLAGWQVAGRFSIGLAVLLPPLGGALLWLSIHRRWHPWMLSFGLLAWSATLINAFLNFQIAIGLALVFAAAEPWLLARPLSTQLIVRAAMSVALLLAHPFGLLFYALLLGALAIGPRLDLRQWRPILLRLLIAAVSIGGVLVLFVLLVPSLPGTEEKSGLGTVGAELLRGFGEFATHKKRKLADVLFAIRSYNNLVDGLTLLVFMLPPAIALATRRLQVHAGLLLLSVGLAVVYFLCPGYLTGASWIDVRFAVMWPFAFAAGLLPMLPRRSGAICASLLVVALVGRTAFVGSIWQARQVDLVSLADALAPVPAGASIITLEHRAEDRRAAPVGRYNTAGENSYRHLPALAVPWRHAFVPSLFAARGKQPVMTVPPWDALSEPNGGLLGDIHAIDPVVPEDMDVSNSRYVPDWRKFDYLLIINADIPDEYGPFKPPAGVTLVRDAGFAQLYRIAH